MPVVIAIALFRQFFWYLSCQTGESLDITINDRQCVLAVCVVIQLDVLRVLGLATSSPAAMIGFLGLGITLIAFPYKGLG